MCPRSCYIFSRFFFSFSFHPSFLWNENIWFCWKFWNSFFVSWLQLEYPFTAYIFFIIFWIFERNPSEKWRKSTSFVLFTIYSVSMYALKQQIQGISLEIRSFHFTISLKLKKNYSLIILHIKYLIHTLTQAFNFVHQLLSIFRKLLQNSW